MPKEDGESKSYYQELKAQNEQMRAKLSVLENEGKYILLINVGGSNSYENDEIQGTKLQENPRYGLD